MSIESVNEVVFRRSPRGRLSKTWLMMGYIFQIIREIDPKLRVAIDTFTLLGIIYSARLALSFFSAAFNGFRVHLWSRVWPINLKKYGKWAVITGATDGIGLEYARLLAAKGIQLILVGRSEEKLAKVRQELASRVQVVTVVADFNSDDPELYRRIANEIDGDGRRDIGILFNNAGVMFDSPNRFLDQPEDKVMQHVRVNMTAVLMMTRAVLPGMIRRRRGLVINMSSIAGFKPLPLMGVYSASKVFVEWFSRTLQYEYSNYNIEVQTLVPNYIGTKLTSFSDVLQKPSLLFPDAKTFAKNAVATIGRTDHTTGYWSHGLQHFMYEWLVPGWVWSLSSWHFLKNIDSSKKRQVKAK